MDNLFNKIEKTIKKYQMIKKGEKIIAAVSGGMDSVFLLHFLYHIKDKYGLSIIVAHLNHGIRGDEAKRDADFVEKLAKDFSLPFIYEFQDVPKFKKEHSLCMEEAARILRYRFLDSLRIKIKADKIALGHNLNDKVETIFINIIRGSAAAGIASIKPVLNNIYIRPLIETKREDIEKFITENNIPFVTDSTNLKDDYLRNHIRKHLIPFIEKNYNLKIKESLAKLSYLITLDDDFLNKLTNELLYKEHQVDTDEIILNIPLILKKHKSIIYRIIKNAFELIKGEKRGIAFSHIDSIIKIIYSSHPNIIKVFYPVIVKKEYDKLRMTKKAILDIQDFSYTPDIPGVLHLPEIDKDIEFVIIENNEKNIILNDPNYAFLDYEKLILPLKIRNRRIGDRFRPLGMKQEMKLKNFFINLKIPKPKRNEIPLLVSGDKIAWVAGYRISDLFKVTEDTKKILMARLY